MALKGTPMHGLNAASLTLVCLTFILAGFVKGVSGMGLPTVAMGVLGSVLPPAEAAALLVLPSLVTNVWQCLSGGRLLLSIRRFWPMLIGILLGTALTGAFLANASQNGSGQWAKAGLGTALIVYAALGLMRLGVAIGPRVERHARLAIGVITGMITGVTGVFVIPAVPFLQSLSLPKDAMVQTLGLSFTVSTIGLALVLVWHGAWHPGNLTTSIIALVPALIGMALGERVRRRINAKTFRKGFYAFLLLLGLELLGKAVFGVIFAVHS